MQVRAASDLSALASLIPATSRLALDPGAPPIHAHNNNQLIYKRINYTLLMTCRSRQPQIYPPSLPLSLPPHVLLWTLVHLLQKGHSSSRAVGWSI